MNIASLNIRGVGTEPKVDWVRRLCFENKISLIGIQETMSNDVNRFLVRALWGNYNFDYAAKSAKGKSGGILAIWDTHSFTLH